MYKIIGADGKEYGPVSLAQLRQWLSEGRVNQETRVLPEGGSDWQRLGAVPEFTPVNPPPGGLPGQVPGFKPLPVPPRRVNPYAIAGLVLGVISLPLAFCCAGVPFNVLGIVFSAIGLSQIKDRPDEFTGKGIAFWGLISSILGLVLGITILTLSMVFNWDQVFLNQK